MRIRTTVMGVGVSFIASIIAIVLLFVFSDRINHRQNGFTRLIRHNATEFLGELDIRYNAYSIAGISKRYIYLCDFTDPTNTLDVTKSLVDSHFIKWVVPKDLLLVWQQFKVTIDSPYIYMIEGTSSSFLSGEMPDLHLNYHSLGNTRFTSSEMLSGSSFIAREYDNSLKQNILSKFVMDSPLIRQQHYLLEKQQDGVFSTDGILLFNKTQAQIFYVYFYRNQFICLDTNLTVKYAANTIDTTKVAKIKIANLYAGTASTMNAPPLFVNKKACVWGANLYINSGLRANNEEKVDFDAYSVIDVYSTRGGIYQYSFYLPTHRGFKLSSFIVQDHFLVGLYDHYLLTFKVNY